MDLAGNKNVIRSFFEAGNRGDLESALGLLADDVTWTNIGSTRFSGTYSGKEALTANLLGPLFDQLRDGIRSTIDNVVAEGELVAVQSRGRAETRDGRPYNNTYCHVFRVREGRIVEVKEYLDTELVSSVFGR